MEPDGATLSRLGAPPPVHRWHRRATNVVLGAAAVCAVGRVLARTVRRVEVVGGSMAPALLAGDRLVVLSRPFGPPGWPAVGTVVAVADPRDPDRTLVKRVVAVDRHAATVEVRGDDPGASTDSRTFGPVPVTSVVGRAVYRYAPAGRTGPGPWPTEYDRT
jgi:nickel-type superoxide dismutase maturation protease